MPKRPDRRCACGANVRAGSIRCAGCEARRNSERPQYRGSWPAESRRAIAAYRAEHGDICPGWGVPPHPVTTERWCTDHDAGPMCVPCNSRKAATADKARAARR